MDIVVDAQGVASFGDARYRCAIGRSGIALAKREGDGATPAGRWPLRRILYRPDRGEAPRCAIAIAPLDPKDGWCDDPAHADYNRQVRLPHPASCEALWRDDGLYDLVVVLGYNDAPVVAGRGSAIFLHVARADFGATQGCVALAREDLIRVLAAADAGTALLVSSI